MNYPDSLKWLDSLTLHGIKLGLEKTRALAAHLGDPQRAHPVVLIGGTNGKGSTLAFLASLLMAAGKKVGQYTSPHLISPRERIVINDAAISETEFAAALDAVRAAAERAAIIPTYFEAVTLAAFRFFADRKLDIVLLEVGLGGRLDATNIAEPLLTLITSLDYDHMEYLGPTLTDIAREKAGIMRTGIPVICGARSSEAVAALREAAEKSGAPLEFLEEFARWEKNHDGDLIFNIAGVAYPPLQLSLAGGHQIRNAALALRAAQQLAGHALAGPPEIAASALPLARWPGRLQPFFNGKLWLDGAHNPEGAAALRDFVQQLPRPRRLLFGCMRDKAIPELAATLFPAFDEIWLLQTGYARGASPAQIRAALPAQLTARDFASPAAALAELGVLSETPAAPDCTTVIAGSLFLVGECLELLQR